MRYHQKQTKGRPGFVKRYGVTVLAIILLGSGLYLLFLVFSPQINQPTINKTWNEPVPYTKAALTENRIYVPKLKLNLPYKAGDATVLRDNIWHRFPERGDPESGGNFILAGHRFDIGLTPGETKHRSPFYHIDALHQGDKIYADFDGKRYLYEVADRFKVKPTQTEIEAPSDEPKMTLYTCTFQGSADGREVIIAHLAEKDVDPAKALVE